MVKDIEMKPTAFLFLIVVFCAAQNLCQEDEEEKKTQENDLELTYDVAKNLASLPLECYNRLYPFKFNNVWKNASEVAEHQVYIPIFSGCYDWHSSVHGHWLLASVLNRYPDSELSKDIINVFDKQFTVSESIGNLSRIMADFSNAIRLSPSGGESS